MRTYIRAKFTVATLPTVTKFPATEDRAEHSVVVLFGSGTTIPEKEGEPAVLVPGRVQFNVAPSTWSWMTKNLNPFSVIEVVGTIADEPEYESSRGTPYFTVTPTAIGHKTEGGAGGLPALGDLDVRVAKTTAKKPEEPPPASDEVKEGAAQLGE